MTSIAVIVHVGKTFGDGLPALRRALADAGHAEAPWYEVARNKQIPAAAREILKLGVDLVFVWGGDGTVRKCIEAFAGHDVSIAILPAGTGNLLARNLELPCDDVLEAVTAGLGPGRRVLDTGTVNGEQFAIMAGAGLDALMMQDADNGLKDRVGRVAYVWTGARNLTAHPVKCTVEVEGRRFFKGPMTCILIGNLSKVMGGVSVFEDALPDDGILEFGIANAKTRTQWARTLTRVVAGRTDKSPFVVCTRGTRMRVIFDRAIPYELDGSVRKPAKKLRIRVHPKSVSICSPVPDERSET